VRLIFRVLYPIYRLFSAARFWASRRFTPAGRALLVSLMIVLPLAVDTENNVAYQVACLLFVLLLTSTFFGGFVRTKLTIERRLPRFASMGEPFHYPVHIHNLSPRKQAGLAYLETLADARPAASEWIMFQRAEERRLRRIPVWRRQMRHPFRVARHHPVPIPVIPPNQSAEVQMTVTPLRRGVMRFAGVTIARSDPLGLFNALWKTPLPQSVLVLPRRYFIPAVALPGAIKYQQGGVAMASSVGQSDEFVALREYRRGDPYRHIHWRSWAKTGMPIVKEHEDEFFVRHALVLDTFSRDPFSEAFEEAISVAASFACTIQSQESLLDLLFVGAQAYCFTAGRGLAHSDQLLEVLASVQAHDDQTRFNALEELVLSHAAQVSGCICVFLIWDEPRRELVRKLRMLGTPLLVLLVVEPGRGRNLDPGPMRDEPQNFQILEVGLLKEGLATLNIS
jgi:uncharacterized protein (DUF58 family)